MDRRDYRYDLLKQKAKSSRGINIARICRNIGISRTHFYKVLEGGVYVSEKTLRAIIDQLGMTPQEIILEESHEDQILA